jgi:hypothetical protein
MRVSTLRWAFVGVAVAMMSGCPPGSPIPTLTAVAVSHGADGVGLQVTGTHFSPTHSYGIGTYALDASARVFVGVVASDAAGNFYKEFDYRCDGPWNGILDVGAYDLIYSGTLPATPSLGVFVAHTKTAQETCMHAPNLNSQ